MAKKKILKTMFVAPVLCLTIGALTSCGKEAADLVVYSDVFTAEEGNNGLAEAFAVKDGKYVYVGTKEGAKAYIKEGKTQVLDNKGLIIPGCTEGHAHYLDGVGLNSQLPGSGETYEKVLELIEKKYKEEQITQFISFGWKTMSLHERKMTGHNFAEEIEAKAPGIPVVLIDDSGHSAVCNKTALERAGITKENPTVRGGAVYFDKDGELSGYIGDQAVFYVSEKVISRPFSDAQYRSACEYGMNELLSQGYTNALDAFTNMYDPTGLYEALQKMDNENKLKINISECFNMKSFDSIEYKAKIDEIVEIKNKYSSKHCDASYIKLFLDGVVESGTGWIFGEYKSPVDGKVHGNIIWDQPEVDALVSYANHNGLTIHAHTFGDAACKSALDAFINSNELNSNEYRNCLAHVRNIKTADIERAAKNNIPVAENLLWHTDYNEKDPDSKATKDLIVANIGEDYYYSGYPMKSLVEKGVIVSSSTDAPAAMDVPGNILNVIEVSTTGMAPGDNGQVFAANELLSVKEALKCLTINGAYQLGIENERGSIKVGKYADFVVLDTNFLNYQGAELRNIHNTKIVNTYFEGEVAYKAN